MLGWPLQNAAGLQHPAAAAAAGAAPHQDLQAVVTSLPRAARMGLISSGSGAVPCGGTGT